jgi:hypothetical protein
MNLTVASKNHLYYSSLVYKNSVITIKLSSKEVFFNLALMRATPSLPSLTPSVFFLKGKIKTLSLPGF